MDAITWLVAGIADAVTQWVLSTVSWRPGNRG